MSFAEFYYDPFVEFNHMLDDALSDRNITPPVGQEPQGQVQRHRTRHRSRNAAWPRLDVHENAQTNTVEATFELPGLKKEDVNIDVHNNRLTVSGENKQSSEHEEAGYAVRERHYGKFSRTLQLPTGINANNIKASMEHGLLTVTFPKSAPQEAPKKITVS